MNHKSLAIFIVAFLLFYLLFLVVYLPASWMTVVINRANVPVEMHKIHGTIWAGSAAASIRIRQSDDVSIGNISWRLNPLYFMFGKLGFVFFAVDYDYQVSGKATIGFDSLRIQNLQANLPLARLHSLYPPASLFGIRGDVEIQATDLLIDTNRVNANGEIHVKQISSSLYGPEPLGTYLILVSSDENELIGQIQTKNGQLKVDATGSWQPLKSGIAKFNGEIRTTGQNAKLKNLLLQIGKTDDSGSIRINWKGRIGSY